jgi:hypothetical protein
MTLAKRSSASTRRSTSWRPSSTDCRNFILVSRIATFAGAGLLTALLLGIIRFNATEMIAAIRGLTR